MPEIDPNDRRYVPPDGDPKAKIVILGEAPGAQEQIQKTPFVGPSGDLLFKDIFHRAGITRKDCYILNVSPIKPPADVFKNLTKIGISIDGLIEDARKLIFAHPRDMIIAVGNWAMWAMKPSSHKQIPIPGPKNITQYRGSYLFADDDKTPVIPMVHPAAVLRQWPWLTWCRHDAKRIKFHLDNPNWDSDTRTLYTATQRIERSTKKRVIHEEPHDCQFFLTALEKAASAPISSFDIETFAETITVFGFALSPTEAYSIPFTGVFSAQEEALLVETIQKYLIQPTQKVAQNGVYDCTYLANEWGVSVRGFAWDTMLMHHCIYAEHPHSLAFITSIYTNEPFFKQMAKEVDTADYDNAHWEYNALDVACTLEAQESLLKELKLFKVLDFYLSHYVPLTRALANIQRRGIKIDNFVRGVKNQELEVDLNRSRRALQEQCGFELNANSPKQMSTYLYDTLGLVPITTPQGGRTTNEMALRTLRRKHPARSDLFDIILNIREKQKLLSTYIAPKKRSLEDPDGRVRTSYNIAGNARTSAATGGTETGRLSSSENAYGRGANLQNVPKDIRDMYIPDPGMVFWQADLSSAESYIVAWDSGDERMLEILTRHNLYDESAGDKIWYHEFIGNIITGLSIEEIVDDIRDAAKSIGHGWNYGMGTRKLVEVMNNEMPTFPFNHKMAVECYAALDRNLSSVVTWRDTIRWRVRQDRTLRNCFGRMRIFMGRFDEPTFREAFAFIPQSEVSDWLNKCLFTLEDKFSTLNKVDILGQVHDSIYGQCTPEMLDQVRDETVETLQRPLPRECRGEVLRIPCEFKSGANWKET